jgi:hypothetical protein
MKPSLLALLLLSTVLQAGEGGSRAQYVGGTVPGLKNKSDIRITVTQEDCFTINAHHESVAIPYKDVTNLEYGMRVNRRYLEAVLISPIFLAAKKKAHFLTIGYTDKDGKNQAMVLEVSKDDIRPLLVSLEARTGRRIDYQDEEARKAGRG